MSKRSSAGWLIGIVVALTTLGLAASLIPMRECGSCHGLALSWTRLKITIPPPLGHVDCPDCADRGKVSLLRAWRPRVSEEIGQILRGLQDPSGTQFTNAVKQVISKSGMAPDSFLKLNDHIPGTFGLARFVRVEGNLYLVIPANYRGMMMPGDTGAGVLLLHPDGRALDWVQMACSTREALLYPRILEKTEADGAQMLVLPSPGMFLNGLEPTISCQLNQWRRKPREENVAAAGAPEVDGVCRMRIRGDQIEVLTPQK